MLACTRYSAGSCIIGILQDTNCILKVVINPLNATSFRNKASKLLKYGERQLPAKKRKTSFFALLNNCPRFAS